MNQQIQIFHPPTGKDKDVFEKLWEGMVAEPYLVLTKKAVLDDFFIRKKRICANRLWVLMLVSFIPNQCVC